MTLSGQIRGCQAGLERLSSRSMSRPSDEIGHWSHRCPGADRHGEAPDLNDGYDVRYLSLSRTEETRSPNHHSIDSKQEHDSNDQHHHAIYHTVLRSHTVELPVQLLVRSIPLHMRPGKHEALPTHVCSHDCKRDDDTTRFVGNQSLKAEHANSGALRR